MFKIVRDKIVAFVSEIAYKIALFKHARNLPALEQSDRPILARLKKEGVYVTSLEELGFESSSDMLKAANLLLPRMAKHNQQEVAQKLPDILTVTQIPAFAKWGRSSRLLDIIENYIGLSIAFHGVHLRKDFQNQNQFGTLLWHKDSEDRRMIKAIIYLNDVEDKHGPFEYAPLALTSPLTKNFYRIYYLMWKSGYLGINDETLSKIVPKSAWKSCPGKAGTVILVDTKRVLHHGTIRTEERGALFFVYTANPPKQPQDCTQYWDDSYAKPDMGQYVDTTTVAV
jgi:hypothetical protein